LLVYGADSDSLLPVRVNKGVVIEAKEEEKKKPTAVKYVPFTPQTYHDHGTKCTRPVLMWHPSLESTAQNILSRWSFRASHINWSYFPDGWPNITFEQVRP